MQTKYFTIYLFLSALLTFAPSYGADNILTNPDFETGNTSGWSSFWCDISAATVPHSGSYSGLAYNRTDNWNGISQSLLGLISDGQTCSVSGWVKIQNAPSADVKITIKQTDDGGDKYTLIGQSTVSDSGWANITGAFTLSINGTLTQLFMYFEGPEAGIDLYVDDVSVIVTSGGDWETEANARIEQIRKCDFSITVVDPNNPELTIPDVNVQVSQTKHHFAFGSAISRHQMSNTDYLDFFKDHFEWAVMENASKWYANEPSEDYVTYEDADEIYTWCSTNNIKMRGHCIFWASENMVQDWIKALSYAPLPAASELRSAVEDRLDSAVNHFKGKFLHWDVNNEMCDNSFFADRLGDDICLWMFQAAAAIDPSCILFLNDYNVISEGYNLSTYKQMAYNLIAQGAPVGGLGVQCHMSTGFDPAVVKARFDAVADVNLPVWVTEFDISQPDENIRADELEDFYRVAFSHPTVEGILMWGFWEDSHWREDCYIVNSDWSLNAAGVRYETIMDEWTTNDSAVTDINGIADFNGFYGTYDVTLTLPGEDPTVTTIKINPGEQNIFRIDLTGVPIPTTCRQVQDFDLALPGDLDGDCIVNHTDLQVLTNQWLSTDPYAILPNYSPDISSPEDDNVNLLDFAFLALDWLNCNNPQDDNCLRTW